MRERVLVLHVDDEPGSAELTARHLERADDRLDVRTATTPKEGLELLAAADFDCIVSDYEMPQMDGIEFLEAVRETHPKLPFILYTGKGSEEIASEAISAGVSDYIQKRTGTEGYELLYNRIQNAVEKYRTQSELQATRRQFREIHRATRELMSATTRAEIAELTVEGAQDALALPLCGVYEYDADRDALVTAAVTPRVAELLTELPVIERDGGVAWTAYESGESQLYEDIREAPEVLDPETPIRSAIHVPLGTHGVLVAASTEADDFGPADVTATEILAANVESALDRAERERELRRKSDLFEQAQEIADIGAWETDYRTGEGWWSEQVNRIYGLEEGYDPGDDPDSIEGFEYFHPEDRPRIRSAFERAAEAAEPYDLELRVEAEDGRLRWVRARGRPALEDGEVVRVHGTLQDITERKRREQKLERYKHFVEYSPELIVVLNDDMTVQYQSPPSPAMEVDPQSILGENPLEEIHDDDVPEALADIRAVIEDPDHVATTEYRARDANGDWQWFENRTQNYLGTEPIDGLLVTVREVTDRKTAERRLAAYSETLEELQEATQTLLETTDERETAELVSRGIEEALSFDIGGLWLADDAGEALEPVALTTDGEELFEHPPTYSAADESLSWAAFSAGETRVIDDLGRHENRFNTDTPLRSELIVPVGDHGVVNIGSTEPGGFTDRDVLLAELWSDTASVVFDRIERERRLEENEAELVAERDRLEEFASVVSHDLRNPLGVAKGNLELARDDADSDDLERVAAALDRREALIEELLALSRAGERVTDPEPVELRAVVEDCWGTVETAEGTLFVDDDPRVVADKGQLRRLLENLIRNAVTHGGEAVSISVGELPDGFYLEDDGAGIPEADRESIFEAGHSTNDDGTGFGLSIVEEIVDGHGWTIEATESADGGARFEITGVERPE